jgi:outer membrane receptor protein involved in Fe transport
MISSVRALVVRIPALLFAVLLIPGTGAPATAQSSTPLPTGRIVGRIIDASNGTGLVDVGIQIVGTTLGTTSGLDGRYVVANVPAGTVSIQVRRIGFAPKTVTGLFLDPNEVIEQDISLATATIQLATEVVTASAERGTVTAALDMQRTAAGIVSAVTAEQISKSPDSDAAAAVQRVSGVTIQDGKNVSVRGLGERYATTTLNGARLPSPDPEKRIVPFDLFPAGLLQTITTSKTFTPDLAGDFAGAQVDIQTREFPASRQITYSTSVGLNDAAGGTSVRAAPSVGLEWLGFGGDDRALPAPLARTRDFGNLTQPQVNQAVNSLRNVWSSRVANGLPNGSLSASIGGSDPLFGHRVGYLAFGTYSRAQEARVDERQAIAEAIGTDGTTSPANEFVGSTGRSTVLWGGLFNVSTLVGQRSRLALNNTYTRTADNEARFDVGSDDASDLELQRTQLRYVDRSIRSSQLLGEHQLGDANRFDWSLTASGVTRSEPDRADVVYGRGRGADASVPFRFLSSYGATRSFSDLTENSYGAAANYQRAFGTDAQPHRIKVGAAYRTTAREAENMSYNITAPQLPVDDRLLAPEKIFDGRFAGPGDAIFQIQPLTAGGSYTAGDQVAAAYTMVDYALFDRMRIIAGARVEHSDLNVSTAFVGGASIDAAKAHTDLLPSLVLNIRATDNQSVRLSASQTLSRPEYREISPAQHCAGIGRPCFQGNPDLDRSLVQNYDARWEWYPNAGELLSVALFAKRFDSPIESVQVPTSGASQYTFINAIGAENLGVEIEARKGLTALGAWMAPVTVFANATIMRSEIDPGNARSSASTRKRPMVGQAPYVINGGLTYASVSGAMSATALYNVVGERVTIVGTDVLPDIYERPRQVLDLSLRLPVMGGVSAKLDAKNLFDSEVVVKQGDVIREGYRAGRVFSAGLTWQP